jgi:hypothetical protein
MARKKELEIHRRVGIAMSVLPSAQRSAVSRVLSSPSAFIDYAADLSNVKKLTVAGEHLYLLRVTPQIRLVYSTSGGSIQILDLVERATMDRLAPKKVASVTGQHKGTKTEKPAASKTKTGKSVHLAKK